MTIEYRIKPVTRYILTRHTSDEHSPNPEGRMPGYHPPETRQIGPEYTNADIAYEVGYALARQDAENHGYGPGDDRIRYPQHPGEPGTEGYVEYDDGTGSTVLDPAFIK